MEGTHPGPDIRVVTTVADALVATLAEHGVTRLFLNPGTDTAPVQEAVLAATAAGRPAPAVVLCLHEAVALAAAHAYYAVTGHAQVVMVHVDVGTQNLGSMVHNAARAEAGVVIIAGRTPYTSYGEELGGRDSSVHWLQDVADQAGVVRPYVKLIDDLARPATLVRQLRRAFQVATSRPPGPVYLTAARESLMALMSEPADTLPVDRFGPPAAPGASREAASRAAALLLAAQRPVIVTSRAGRNPHAVDALVRIADFLGAPVIDTRERVNFPSTHSAYVRRVADARAVLTRSDAVLVVDAPVPWVPASAAPPTGASIVVLDQDPVHASMPSWSFPVDVALQCDPGQGLLDLLEFMTEADNGTARAPWWSEPAITARADCERLDAADVARALDQMLEPQDIVVEEATTNAEAIRANLHRTVPGTYFRAGGSGLGWALGALLGVKLARPQCRVIGIVGDGAFLFGGPSAALWSLREYDAPALLVILRNGGYAASRRPVLELFPDGQSATRGDVVGTLFQDSPDLAAVARACGAVGVHVSSRDELAPALAAAAEAVAAGRTAVVVVEVGSPWI